MQKKLKQVIVVREDLKLPKGKLASQVAHASVAALLKSHKDDINKWKEQGMKKVVLKVKDKKELFKYKNLADDTHLVTALISDQGKTVLKSGTITCLGIGPDIEEKIDKVTGKLKMV
jgi:PTH2 family peptidyl-tRNA hydrolase